MILFSCKTLKFNKLAKLLTENIRSLSGKMSVKLLWYYYIEMY